MIFIALVEIVSLCIKYLPNTYETHKEDSLKDKYELVKCFYLDLQKILRFLIQKDTI